MTEQDKLTYLKLAFRCVELGFTDMEVELISRTYESIKKKKGNFNLRDAAIIRTEVLRKHRPVVEDDFKELEEMEEEREVEQIKKPVELPAILMETPSLVLRYPIVQRKGIDE